MEDQDLASKNPLKSGIVYASILLLSTAAGAGFMLTVQRPKSDGSQIEYEFLMVRVPRKTGDRVDFAESFFAPGAGNSAARYHFPHVRYVLLTSERMPATVNVLKRWRLDFVPLVANQGTRTKLTISQSGLTTHHILSMQDGERRCFSISSVDSATSGRTYAAVTVRVVSSTQSAPTVTATRSRTPQSKN